MFMGLMVMVSWVYILISKLIELYTLNMHTKFICLSDLKKCFVLFFYMYGYERDGMIKKDEVTRE